MPFARRAQETHARNTNANNNNNNTDDDDNNNNNNDSPWFRRLANMRSNGKLVGMRSAHDALRIGIDLQNLQFS